MSEVAVQSALGERLRAIRQLRRKTLKSVATAAGSSESFLSQRERGRTNTTLAPMQRLPKAIRIEVSGIFTSAAERHRDLRSEAREFFAWGDLDRKALLTPKPFHSIALVVARFEPGGSTGDEPY